MESMNSVGHLPRRCIFPRGHAPSKWMHRKRLPGLGWAGQTDLRKYTVRVQIVLARAGPSDGAHCTLLGHNNASSAHPPLKQGAARGESPSTTEVGTSRLLVDSDVPMHCSSCSTSICIRARCYSAIGQQ